MSNHSIIKSHLRWLPQRVKLIESSRHSRRDRRRKEIKVRGGPDGKLERKGPGGKNSNLGGSETGFKNQMRIRPEVAPVVC